MVVYFKSYAVTSLRLRLDEALLRFAVILYRCLWALHTKLWANGGMQYIMARGMNFIPVAHLSKYQVGRELK